jgi:hypothetical protein
MMTTRKNLSHLPTDTHRLDVERSMNGRWSYDAAKAVPKALKASQVAT